MAVDRSERTQSWTTVVFADLDEFKAINDTLGHGAGDEVLATVARRLRSTLRVGDTCGRWGGDEFVMVLELEESTVINDIMRRLQAAFVLPIAVGDGTVSVGASLGVAMAQSFASIDQLLKLADDAMYRSKQCGHATVFTLTPDGDSVDDGAVTAGSPRCGSLTAIMQVKRPRLLESGQDTGSLVPIKRARRSLASMYSSTRLVDDVACRADLVHLADDLADRVERHVLGLVGVAGGRARPRST